MALSHSSGASGNTGTGTALSLSGGQQAANPAVGDLVAVYVTGPNGATFSGMTDNNGASGGTWYSLGYLTNATRGAVQVFYKQANAADHAALNSLSCTMSPSGAWTMNQDIWTGFTSHGAVIDLAGTFSSGAGTVQAATVTFSGSPAATNEVVIYLSQPQFQDAGGTETRYYSPDGGTTHYSVTNTNAPTVGWYAIPTTGGSSPESVFSWTGTALVANAFSATFRDGATGNMLAVMGL